MIMNIALSFIGGTILGGLYGLFFVKRVRNYFAIPSQDNNANDSLPSKARPFILLFSFLTSYLFAGCALYILMSVFHVNVLWGAVFFLVSFWIVAWRHSKKLL